MWIAKIGFSDKKVLMRILFTICYVLLYQFIWVEYCCDNFDYYGFTMIEYDFYEYIPTLFMAICPILFYNICFLLYTDNLIYFLYAESEY